MYALSYPPLIFPLLPLTVSLSWPQLSLFFFLLSSSFLSSCLHPFYLYPLLVLIPFFFFLYLLFFVLSVSCHPSLTISILSLSLFCLSSPPPPYFLFFSPKPSTSCLHRVSLFCYCFLSTAGLTTQACSPIRRPSQSGLWCWETSNGQDQRLHTGWDPSVVMETVSPYQFLHVSPVCMLLLVFLSTCFVTFWDILILFTLFDFIRLYIKMSYS